MDALMRVTVPNAPIPRITWVLFKDLAASSMLVRSLNEPTENAPLAMSQSIPFSMEAMRSALGVPVKS